MSRRLCLTVGAVAAACCLASWSGRSAGQFQVRPIGPAEAQNADGQSHVQPPTDRTLSRGVERAQTSIAAGEFVQAIRFLDDILGRDEDVFVESGTDGGFSGLKETARRLIRDLPADGRAAYEAAYGPTAERLLKQATATGDATTIEAVAQRYFYTPAGYQAALLSATNAADAGSHLSAALIYQELLNTPDAVRRYNPELSVRAAASWFAAGESKRAQEILADLAAAGKQTVEVAGREHRLDSTAEPLEWLRSIVGEPAGDSPGPRRQWITYRGNAARSGETNGGLPHMRVRWGVRLMNHPRLESLFEDYSASLVRGGGMSAVAGAPLAAGDYVLVRTPDGLLAVDFRTGKRVWRTEPQNDPSLKALIRGGAGEEAANPEAVRSFARRMWEDYLYGLASCDGSRVFIIRDLPMPPAQEYELGPFMGGSVAEAPSAANRLSAYDLATQGKLVWEIDGATTAGNLAGAFFLGAPVAVGPSLYALVEIKDAVYLAALDRATGELQWRQLLAHLEAGETMDLERRLQASMPSYDGGMLVCPTGAGLVVGVDLAKRSLEWAYRYSATPRTDAISRAMSPDAALAGQWLDGAATVVGDRVVITPPESRELHCLDLRSGRLLWKHDRGDMLRLACVHDGRIMLVGAKSLSALNLADGKPAWDGAKVELPNGASASGSGFLSDGKYYLPLTTAEVAAIDVGTGRILARAAARNGESLGNLICHRGSVISQNGLFLDCFDQVDVLRKRSEKRLAKNADDVEALRTLGEVAYNAGRLSEAIELLERAYVSDRQDMLTRDVLAECLASALDEDFAAHRARLPLLKELEDGVAARRLQLLRIESQGLLEEHDPLAAAAACYEIYRLSAPNDELLAIGREHQASASRWVGAQIAAAWRQANEEQRKTLVSQVLELAAQVDMSPDAEPLERFLGFFGTLPLSDRFKLARARQLVDERRALEAQQLLLDLVDSSDAEIRLEAIARISAQLHGAAGQTQQAGIHALAADYDRMLSQSYADEICLDGATGRELVDRWRAEAGELASDWPQGKVQVASVAASSDPSGRFRSPMRIVRWERCDGILGQVRGLASAPARGGEMLLEDGTGREFFRAPLEQENPNQYRPPGNAYGVTRGNLAVVSLGRQLVAYNTLPVADGPTPTILWRAALSSNVDLDQTGYFDDMGGGGSRRPGSFRPGRSVDRDQWIGVIGPVTSRNCVFQDQRRLVCVDAITGEVQWSRTDVPLGCDLFGDDQFVFAAPKDAAEARLFDAVDGRDLGVAKVPRWSEQLATIGRRVVRWSRGDDNRRVLSSVDASTGAVEWSLEFEAGAGVDVDQCRYVAVVEPQGRLAIVDAHDGHTLVDQQIPRQPSLEEVHLMVDGKGFLVATDRRGRAETDRVVRPFNALDSTVVTGQIFYFDRQSGQPRWSRPADVLEQAMLINEPADVPFISFAGMLEVRKQSVPGGERVVSRAGATILILDKRTGRTLYGDDSLPAVNTGLCLARIKDGAAHEAALEMGSRTITLQFTSDRRPPEPPAMAEVESSASRTSGGLMGIIRNLGEGAGGGNR